jgi:hypothetical protein
MILHFASFYEKDLLILKNLTEAPLQVVYSSFQIAVISSNNCSPKAACDLGGFFLHPIRWGNWRKLTNDRKAGTEILTRHLEQPLELVSIFIEENIIFLFLFLVNRPA